MTQSSMHLPPLRHGRRAKHTEAAGTERGGAVTSSLPDPKESLRNGCVLCWWQIGQGFTSRVCVGRPVWLMSAFRLCF